jgi:hypothetical protein
MWRVRDHDGRLSDIVNLTRAKDAAGIIALGILNRPRAIALPAPEHGDYQGENERTDPAATLAPAKPENAVEPVL